MIKQSENVVIALKRILIPTDFSRFSEPAIDMARLLVDQFEAELHALHVTGDAGELLPDFGMGLDLQPLREAWARGQQERDDDTLARLSGVLGEDWKQGKHTAVAARTGKPFVEIVRYARDHQIDLIVMGTHGRSGLSHAMLGSVAENVVRLAPCPVLTVRPIEHQFTTP